MHVQTRNIPIILLPSFLFLSFHIRLKSLAYILYKNDKNTYQHSGPVCQGEVGKTFWFLIGHGYIQFLISPQKTIA